MPDGTLWTALFEVASESPETAQQLGFERAWVRFIAKAYTLQEFLGRVEEILRSLDLTVAETSDAEPYSHYERRGTVAPEIRALARSAEETGFVKFGSFHTFPEDEAGSRKSTT